MNAATMTQFLFIDAAVSDADVLLASVDPAFTVFHLTADEDGLTQIARVLTGFTEVGAVHIVSHGEPGVLMLGNASIDAASLAAHAADLATIRAALSDAADLLLYGCDVAEGDAGRGFIASLADATGADVAASTDLTGSALRGGDWVLEASTGAIEAQALQAEAYAEVLGADGSLPSGLTGSGPWSWGGRAFQTRFDGSIDNSDPENPLRAGNKWDRYALDGVTAGTTVYVYMGNSSTVDDYLQIDRNGTIITQNDDGGDGERSYDAYVSWVYQPGDVIRATTYSAGYRGTYSLYIGTSTGTAATPTDIGSNPPPAPPPATAPAFTDGFSLIATYNDTGASDTFTPTTGSLTATDSTPTGTLTFSNLSGAGTYGTLAVAANGSFVYTPNAAALNALSAGQTATDTFTVRVTDGGLATTKPITVNVVGANDAPTAASNVVMPAVAEDVASAANHGMTVEAMFTPRFADVDSAGVGGIVIVGDASTGTQGAWEYSTDSGSTWHPVGAVSDTSGLVLWVMAELRFTPAPDWNGTPGSLTVHVTDNFFSPSGGFTSGTTRVTFDTTNDAANSGVAVGSRTISTIVTAVNDAPVFADPTPITIGLGETSADDIAPTLDSGLLSGTLVGTDIESHTLHFGIRGAGEAVSGTVTRPGSFGTLSLDVNTGAWSYNPTNLTGINALPEGAVATDIFEVKVIDQLGAESVKTLSVNITGTNDLPVLAAEINIQTFIGGVGGWKFQIPANVFADAEGLGFTYTVDVFDGNGNVIDSITTAEHQGTTPSDWLSFDAASRTLSGTPPPGGAPMMIFRVTATDSENQVVTHSFELRLPPNTAPVSTNDRVSVEYGTDYSLTVADFGSFQDAEGTELAVVSFTSVPNGLMYVQPGLDPTEILPGMIFTRAAIDAGMLKLTNVTSSHSFSFKVSDGHNYSSNGASYQLAVDVHQGVALDPQGPGLNFADTSVTTLLRDTGGVDTWTHVYTTDPLSGFAGGLEVTVQMASGSFMRLGPLPDEVVDFAYSMPEDSGDLTLGTATSVTFSGPQATLNAVLRALQVQPDPITPGIVRANFSVTDTTTTEVATRSITLSPGEPSLNLATDAYYTANGEPQALNPALALSLADQSNGALTSARVQIFDRQMGDVLGFGEDPLTKGDITGHYDDESGVMTLTSAGGEATLDQWTTALQSITFQALIDSPASTRLLMWTVNDGNSIGYGSPGYTRIFFTPANELPTVTHLEDVTVAPGQAVSFTLGAVFADPDGDTSAIVYTATLANGNPLPSWLTFDPDTRNFSGNPPAGTASLDIRVTGTDAGDDSTSSTFSLILADQTLASSAANDVGTATISGTPEQGQTLMVSAIDDDDGYVSTPTYQWQVSSDSGATWTDITGTRAQSASLELAESESGKDVRAQVFYSDNGGTAESPVSNVMGVADVPATGTVTVVGVLTPGETLVANLSDPDGLTSATPTYQWYRDGNLISGATYSAYTLTNADGGATVSVLVNYTDDQGTVESRTGTSNSTIQLGVVAPVAVNDTGTATEASGVGNAVAGSNASGDLDANDTDVNGNIDTTTPITGVRSGGIEGVGGAANLTSGVYTVAGLYGTLTVTRATGAWTYAANQDHPDVEALFTSDTLQDQFNYTVADLTGLSDSAVLTVTINGANDSATLNDVPTVAEFTEDIAEAIRTSFSLIDRDGGTGTFSLRLSVTQGTLRGENLDPIQGVVVTGTDTTVLTISGSSVADVQAWLNGSNLLYTSAPNENGNLNATLTYAVSDDSGTTFRDAGTTALNVAQSNNPPIVDLGGTGSTGNDHTTVFRPRGGEVAIVSADITITDIDPADTLGSATVTLASGAFDNEFGTLYETLRSTAGVTYMGSLGEITIAGNGTTQLALTGVGTQADYQAALQTIVYNNTNPNAFSGDRTITISVSDVDGAASNTGSFATVAPNNAIAVGQRIFIGGVDSGFTVGEVVDSQHFVASGPLAMLATGASLTFWASGAPVTTAVQAGPVVATTTVKVPWTPVIDMSGDAVAGRDHTVTYTEGGASVAIATSDASITDQDGNIASVVITLANHPDGLAESLSISSALVTQLAALSITVTGNNSHEITLSGTRDATFFQIGLRGVRYANSSENPDVTDRVVSVASTDVDGNTGVGADTTIHIHSVNDAPSGSDSTLTMIEDNAHVFSAGDFGFSDVEGNGFLAVTLVSLPGAGSLTLDGVAVTAGQSVLRADIHLGKLVYEPVAESSGNGVASFSFRVQDDAGTAWGGVAIDPSANTITLDVTPVNDAPVMTAAAPQLDGITEDQTAHAGQTIASLVGSGAGRTGVSDTDTVNNGGAGNAPEAVGQGVAITATTGSGGTWEYSLDGGTHWDAVGATSTVAALLLRSSDLVRFVPDEVHGSTASFAFVIWDGASGTAGTTADVTVRGGATAFSTVSDTATLTVAEVNDAPTGADNTLTVGEDGSYALSASEFGYADIDGNAFVAVTLSTLPATGSLRLDGVTVSAGQSVSAADIAAGKLIFHPAENLSGPAQARFGFRMQDDGGTANGAVDIDAAERFITFDVTPANDAPVMTAATPTLTTINENDTANIGQRVSDLVGSGAGKTGVADVDTLNNGGAGNAPERAGQGIAIHSVANNGPAAGGAWEYSTDGGSNWSAVGAVSEGSALLLGASDRIRFLPDEQNATEATFSYYLWDGASGTAGAKVNAATGGGASAFSTGSDTAHLVVTPVNDAPTLDLNGAGIGDAYTAIFRPRGDAVSIVGAGVSIGDVDVLDASTPDTLSSATITIASGAVDNLFGTTYETLGSTAGTSFNGISISGNGSTTVTLTGIASRADYEAALRTIVYSNTNPNAFSGDRSIEISVRDTSVSTGIAGDRLDSNTAVTTVQVPWTPVVDMNGDATAGRNHAVTFTERSAGVAIATSDASIVDQDGNIKQVVVTLTNPLDQSHEKLSISGALVTQLTNAGITIAGNDTHAITLSGNRDGSTFQLALRAIRYVNDSDAPSSTARMVSVETLDQQNNTGVGATTTINIVTINDAPVGASNAVSLNEDTPRAFTVADFDFSDAEGHALASVIVSTLPGAGTITLDGGTVAAGQEITAADIAAGLLVYEPAIHANDVQNGVRTFTFQVRDVGGTANGGIDLDGTPNTLTLNIAPVNDLPTGTVITDAPSVWISGNLLEGQTLTAHFDIADVDHTTPEITNATSYQWQTRVMPNGTWTHVAGATASLHVLGNGDVNLEIRVVVSYVDTSSSTLLYTSDLSTRPAVVADANGDISLTLDTPDPVLIVDPEGDVTVTNTGTGPVTIDGMPDGGTVTVSTDGPVTISNPDGDLTIDNAGPGPVTVTGLNDGSVVTTSGTGPVTIADAEGSIELVNQGPGPVAVAGVDDGAALIVNGGGQTTVSNPDGDLALRNDGTGYVTVTGAIDGADIATSGTGDVYISAPQGDLDLVNDQSPGGDLFVGGVVDGAALNVSGSGPTTLSNPRGDLTIANAGPGVVMARCLLDGKTVTTSGAGDIVIGNPRGDVVLVNQGPGSATVDGVHNGQRVDVGGSGPSMVANPDGDVTVSNTGSGLVTTTGLIPGSTVTFVGSGPQVIDLAGFPGGSEIALNNTTDAGIEVLNAPADAIVRSTGTGDVVISAPSGDLRIHNDGTGTIDVEGLAEDASVVKTGVGPALIDHPMGSFTAVNDDAGLLTVRHLGAGATLAVQGSGPVAIVSQLAVGEHVTVDTTLNSNVQLSNTGAGTIDVLGDLSLDAGDPVRIHLSGDGATALSVAGGLTLDGTPLSLQLDAGYAPHLGDQLTLVDNDGTDAVVGTFAGLPEGAPMFLGGVLFRISYVGGTGNDVVLTRVNDSPLGSVVVTGTVAQNQTLVASHTLTDTDGNGTVSYQWLIGGAVVAVGSSLLLTQAEVGKAITLVAEYTDGEGTVERVGTTTAAVANVNDAPTGEVVVTGTPMLGETLLASQALADIDGMGAVSYQWRADGADIAGATGSSLTLGAGQVGKLISVTGSYVDGQGTTERVSSAASTRVVDGNGVAQAVEAQVPGLGAGGLTGDGNGDGIQDALQAGVVSAPFARSDGGAASYTTLVVDSVAGRTTEGSTARVVEFEQVLAPGDVPAWAQMPIGELGFTALVNAPGVRESFSLYVDANLGVNGYWTLNGDGVLVNLASAAYGGGMVLEGGKLRLDFQLTEGGEFDSGPAGDSSITNVGAAGHASLSLIGYTNDAPVQGALNIWD
jgi:VCBS repeat-containing protein